MASDRWIRDDCGGLRDPLLVPNGGRIAGSLRPPSSKSLTHRYLALALVSRRGLTLRRPLLAEDTRLFFGVLRQLGFAVRVTEQRVEVTPGRDLLPTAAVFDCGNAGTLARFLVGLSATLPGRFVVDGSKRLRERPVGPLVAALRQLGVVVEELGAAGCFPVAVRGGELGGGRVAIDAAESSQYLSALLIAGLGGAAPLDIEVTGLTSEPYVDLTLGVIAECGGRVERRAEGWRVHPGASCGGEIEVEADLSAACYPAAAAALTGGEVELLGVSERTRQGDRALIDLLGDMGAQVSWGAEAVVVRGTGSLRSVAADLSRMPDQVPTLAALAPFAQGTTRITGVPHLRIKESDRLAAMASELGRLGVPVVELADGLVIEGVWADRPAPSTSVTVQTWSDHRIAMSLALVGLRRPGVSIAQPTVVGKSYPGFFRDLAQLLQTAIS